MSGKHIVYVGTYTRPIPHVPESRGDGIHQFELDVTTGELVDTGKVYHVDNPTFLAIHRNDRFLYACSEMAPADGGTVTAYAIDETTGDLQLLNRQSSGGKTTAYISVDKQSGFVMAANYMGDASVALLPIKPNGYLNAPSSVHNHTLPAAGTVPSRQEKSHTHCIVAVPNNQFALACDLGLDKIFVYQLDHQNKCLIPNDPPFYDTHPGAGPRHLVFHPSMSLVYVLQELDSTITALAFDPTNGRLSHRQTIAMLPDAFTENNTASEIQVSPDGRFLYAANRGHDSLSIYAIHPETGALDMVGHQATSGKTPRNFVIDPSGELLLAANQNSHTIISFKINQQTGLLTQVATVDCPTPVCLKIITLPNT